MSSTDKSKLSSLAALFAAFPRQERDGTEKQLLEVYLMAVEGASAGFVAMACRSFITGQVIGASLTFRPTPAELAQECRKLQDKALDRERIIALPSQPDRPRLPRPRQPFRPYPRLWEAFAGEPEIVAKLDNLGSFDKMTRASRTFATEGIDAARKFILDERANRRPGPPRMSDPPGPVMIGNVDVSDFPAANAAWAELREWDARQEPGGA